MKSFGLAFLLCTILAPLPVAAQDGSGFGDQGLAGFAFGLDMENPASILEELVVRGMAYVRDHVEITKRYHEGPTGDDIKAELEVKVYPNGKEHPAESLKGTGALEFLRHPGNLHLRFDFDVSPGPGDRRLDDYL